MSTTYVFFLFVCFFVCLFCFCVCLLFFFVCFFLFVFFCFVVVVLFLLLLLLLLFLFVCFLFLFFCFCFFLLFCFLFLLFFLFVCFFFLLFFFVFFLFCFVLLFFFCVERNKANISKMLRKHAYSNILRILLQKMKTFRWKPGSFHISVQNIDCGYSIEPTLPGGSNECPQSMFLSRNKRNNKYPVNPSFTV